MKTTLPKNIPENRLKELNLVLEVIKKEAKKKLIEIDKIILFGSYARGDFVVKDIRGRYIYMSDFDIFVITKEDLGDDTSLHFQMYVNDKIILKRLIEPPFTFIVEDLSHVNSMLMSGRYFYADIKLEGVVLYDGSGIELAQEKKLNNKEKLEIMKEEYEIWFPSGEDFFETYEFNFSREKWNIAAFQLHQATEKFMTSYLLVKSLYKGKTHDLVQLLGNLQTLDDRFIDWFDFRDNEEYRHFKKLRDAYVRARYDKNYKISKEELKFLEKKVIILRDLIEKLCEEEMERMGERIL